MQINFDLHTSDRAVRILDLPSTRVSQFGIFGGRSGNEEFSLNDRRKAVIPRPVTFHKWSIIFLILITYIRITSGQSEGNFKISYVFFFSPISFGTPKKITFISFDSLKRSIRSTQPLKEMSTRSISWW